MASGIYNVFKGNLMNKEVDLEADVIHVALYNTTHAFSATDTAYTTTNELASSGGYTQGGVALASKAVTVAATTKWAAANPAWATSSFTANHAVIYASSSAALIASIDFGGAKVVSAGTFTIIWDTAGIITLA